jgi:Luciferase-like monooxygenase
MRTGIVMTARPGGENLAARAEELGFSSFWVYDTPMVNGDPFVSLALCAKATTRIKLGIGVTSPALRSAPAAARRASDRRNRAISIPPPASSGKLSITAFVGDLCPLARTNDHAEAVLTHRDAPGPPGKGPRTAQVPAGLVREQAELVSPGMRMNSQRRRPGPSGRYSLTTTPGSQ